jgi:hypothetical protein
MTYDVGNQSRGLGQAGKSGEIKAVVVCVYIGGLLCIKMGNILEYILVIKIIFKKT